jgi:hypothetical protein
MALFTIRLALIGKVHQFYVLDVNPRYRTFEQPNTPEALALGGEDADAGAEGTNCRKQ